MRALTELRLKRATALLLTLAIVFSFTGCQLAELFSAYWLYSRAAKKLERAGGYEADCSMSMSFDILGESIEAANIVMKLMLNDGNSKTVTYFKDETVTSTVLDGFVYVDYAGEKIRYTVTDSDSDSADIYSGMAIAPKLEKEVFEEVEAVKLENGDRSITVNLNEENAMELLGSFMEGVDSVSLKDIAFTVVLTPKGEIRTTSVDCNAVMELLGMEITGRVSAEYSFINFGEAPEITLDSPAEEYIDGGEYQG